MKQPVQGHAAGTWQSQDSSPSLDNSTGAGFYNLSIPRSPLEEGNLALGPKLSDSWLTALPHHERSKEPAESRSLCLSLQLPSVLVHGRLMPLPLISGNLGLGIRSQVRNPE